MKPETIPYKLQTGWLRVSTNCQQTAFSPIYTQLIQTHDDI